MNLDVIKKLTASYDGGLKKLAADAGMSEQNLHRCIRNNKIQASDLENIARLLKVDVRLFFDDDVLSNMTNVNEVKIDKDNTKQIIFERISFLERLLAEKERLIKVYERLLQRNEEKG